MVAKSRSGRVNMGDKLGGSDSPTHFFKIILPSTLEVQRLKIPVKFAKKFGNELCQIATIKVPDGRTWKLGLEEAENRIFFVDGWQRFVEYYSINPGYFLVFKYQKVSTFRVCIFDMTATEIDYPCNGISSDKQCSSEDVRVEIADDDDDDDEILEQHADQQLAGRKRKKLNERATSLKCKAAKWSKNCKLEVQADQVGLDDANRSMRGKAKIEKGTHCSNDLSAKDEDEDENEMILLESKRFSNMKMSKESERAIEAARSCKRLNPCFIAYLRKCNITDGYLNVPAKFVEKYMKSCSEFIRLEAIDGRRWKVCCSLVKGSISVKRICNGWIDLVKAYRLKVGDVSVFELMKHNDYFLLKVFIYHASDYADPEKTSA